MPDKKKPSLSVSKFIFNASNNKKFGDKYLANPKKLVDEYDMAASDMENILALDLKKVREQIVSLDKLDLVKGNVNLAASHTKNSHVSHVKEGHSNSAHSNGSNSIASLRMDELVNSLRRIAEVESIR